MENNRTELVDKICTELDCLLTNACEFIFTEDCTYDAVERDKISEIIYDYRKKIINNE